MAGGRVRPRFVLEADARGPGGSVGYSVASAGDVNGDGFADIMVGAPEYDHPDDKEGGAWVYHGTATGVHTVPDFIAQADQGGAQLGCAVASAGDVNGDGYADVLIGAPSMTGAGGESSEGLVRLYLGSPSGLEAT